MVSIDFAYGSYYDVKFDVFGKKLLHHVGFLQLFNLLMKIKTCKFFRFSKQLCDKDD